ncbi:MAG: alcohol dehydrogenase catalytic domain-containing protein, partial [Alistipes sp.]|nr:alcohol dehydrogenase catalytic domain-containing protein [Alistipes sp.]
MRQAVLTAPEQIEFREVPDLTAERLGEDEILIRIKKIGICGSEIHSYHGEHPATCYPVVQGHEYSGIVTAIGSKVTKCKPGDKVTARPQLACGQCAPCRRGQYNVCENLRVPAFQADGAAQ